MAQIIDGKFVSNKIKEELKGQVTEFHLRTGIKPGLATVLVGHNPASQVYIRNKIKSTQACGMVSLHYDFQDTVSEAELLDLIRKLNHDRNVHGILVQLPLPRHINAEKILEAIAFAKDVDGFHPQNMGYLMIGRPHLKPCTPSGVMKLLEHYQVDPSGKDVTIIGRSNIVGKPMAMLLLQANATVTITHSKTKNLPDKVRQADIVIAAVGSPRFVKGDWIKPGATVIDVGINKLDDGTLCGDVDFAAAAQNAAFITPVPGGVGPMTIAMLLSNTLSAAEKMSNHSAVL